MQDHHHKKKFLNLPKYTGGSKAFREFIAANLRYPDAALEAQVEGIVIVEYDIHDTGIVQHPRVLKGIGHGCDEEAMRVVSLLRFEKVKNRGVRVKMTTKTKISFKLPVGVEISYTTSKKSDPGKSNVPDQPKPGPVSYEYTITF
ncbi:MAG: energy transducer TonB [Bacteroidales bacterium]|nr:energy transducer TonB [Bacteroidales bacterium]